MSSYQDTKQTLSDQSSSDKEYKTESSKETTPLQHQKQIQEMSGQSSSTLNAPTMGEMIRQFNNELARILAEVIMVQEENKELCKQLKAEKSPSPTTSKEKDHDLKELIKTLTAKERKAKIPEPYKWDRNKKQLNTFHWECTTWLDDKREYLTDRCITLITGYMMGTTSKWFTMVSEAASLKNEHWVTTEAFWKAIEGHFSAPTPDSWQEPNSSK